MRSIFLAFANPEAAAKLKKVLASAGLPVPQVCTTGTALLQLAMLSPEGGVIVLPPRLSDLRVPELLARLPDTFDLLVLQSPGVKADYGQLPGLTFLDSPLTPAKLIEMLVSLLNTRMAPSPVGGQADKATVQKRTPQEEALVQKAKAHLMNERKINEEQAHRLMQRRSMETGLRLIEVARSVLERGFI